MPTASARGAADFSSAATPHELAAVTFSDGSAVVGSKRSRIRFWLVACQVAQEVLLVTFKDWCEDAEASRSRLPSCESVTSHLVVFWLWRARPCVRCRKSARVVPKVRPNS
jgi:hypothetical protein